MSFRTPPRCTTGPRTRLGVPPSSQYEREVDGAKLADRPGSRRGDVHELPGAEGQQGRDRGRRAASDRCCSRAQSRGQRLIHYVVVARDHRSGSRLYQRVAGLPNHLHEGRVMLHSCRLAPNEHVLEAKMTQVPIYGPRVSQSR